MKDIYSIINKVCVYAGNAGLLMMMCVCGIACSGSDSDEAASNQESMQQTAISFGGNLQAESAVTRAATGLEEVLTNKSFVVYGYKNDAYDSGTDSYTSYQMVMPGFTVNWTANTAYTTTSNTNDWEYVGQGPDQTIKYWDGAANAYRFFAYAKGNATAAPATSPDEVTVTTAADKVTFSANINASTDAHVAAAPYFSRLWFSTGNAVAYPGKAFGQPVQLQFMKPLARVRFIFTFADGLDFGRPALTSPRFRPTADEEGIPDGGTVTFHYPLKGTEVQESWESDVTDYYTENFDIDYYEPDGVPNLEHPRLYPNSPQHWYYVFPIKSQGTYTLSVDVNGGPKTTVVPAEYMSWKPGYQYTYRFKITESGGVILDNIQVGINDWSIKGVSEHPIYNW